MDTTTIIAMLGVFATLLGIIAQLGNFKKGWAEQIKNQTARDTKMDGRLDNIEKRLDSHNKYAEKFASMTEAITEIKTDIKWIKEEK